MHISNTKLKAITSRFTIAIWPHRLTHMIQWHASTTTLDNRLHFAISRFSSLREVDFVEQAFMNPSRYKIDKWIGSLCRKNTLWGLPQKRVRASFAFAFEKCVDFVSCIKCILRPMMTLFGGCISLARIRGSAIVHTNRF